MSKPLHVTAIIAAGGRGLRFGGARPKQLLSVGGRPVLERSVTAFLTHPEIDEVVVALPEEVAADPPAYLRHATKPLRVVAGGPRRQDSVANAFRAASAQSDVIVVHDAARPFVSADLIARTIAAAAESGAALAALPAHDTVKQGEAWRGASAPHESSVPRAGQSWVVKATLPRESIFLAQTPQAFRRDVLRDALASTAEATDEAALAERAGHPVRLVEGERSNMKITTPDDLSIAEAFARGGHPHGTNTRVGTGYDLHRLVEGRPLVLGGVTIPSEQGLLGHSDADAVCHAVTDAVLGAAGAGDIGRHFPDSDPQWRGASSVDLLRRAVALVRERGYCLVNIDIVVIAESPKLALHIEAMRTSLGAALGVPADRVSVKGKTNEGVGEIGRGEAIAVHAVALLQC